MSLGKAKQASKTAIAVAEIVTFHLVDHLIRNSCPLQAHWYLTQLLLDSLQQAAPNARVVFTTSPSESKTEDIDWDNLE